MNPIRFIEERCKHWKGEWSGRPFVLEEWQKNFIDRIMEVDPETGLRRARTALLAVPRKNGKSTLCAALGLYFLISDDEPGAEVYSCAGDRDQAAIVFDCARNMVEADPVLSAVTEVYRRSIVVPSTGSTYRVLSADAYTKHGLNASTVLFDELHVQKDRDLWDTMETSQGSRRQPMMIAITTAGYDKHSICWEVWDYALKVADGTIDDPTFVAEIYGAGAEDDWKSEATWKKANPNFGVSVKPEFLQRELTRAVEMPGKENAFRRLYLNQWTEQETRWLGMDAWRACGSAVDVESLKGRPCYAGVDLSTTKDLSALVLAFPGDGVVDVLPFFWVPEDNVQERVRRDRVPYDLWIRQGYIEPTEGNVVDYNVVRRRINELGEQYEIREIAIDRWNSTQLQVQLGEDGFTVVPFGQGTLSMSAPSKELEKLILGGKLRHGGHPVLTWNASNVAITTNAAGDIKPHKEKSAERIDGIICLIMALGRALVQPEVKRSVYSTRGIRTL